MWQHEATLQSHLVRCRRIARELVERWSRPIFDQYREHDSEALKEQYNEELAKARQRRQLKEAKAAATLNPGVLQELAPTCIAAHEADVRQLAFLKADYTLDLPSLAQYCIDCLTVASPQCLFCKICFRQLMHLCARSLLSFSTQHHLFYTAPTNIMCVESLQACDSQFLRQCQACLYILLV